MKNAFLFTTLGVAIVLAKNAPAQSSLFTTATDFSGWSATGPGFTGGATSATDLDGATNNGLGNTTAAGATGTPGALSLQWASGGYDYAAYSQGEQGNAAFLSALENGSSLTFDYTTPSTVSGTYFQLGIVVNYQGGFNQLFPSSTISLGNGVTQATINWSSEAAALVNQQTANGGSFSYFQLGLIYNSDFAPSGPFYVDNIQITTVPEPTSIGLAGLGVMAGWAWRRRKA